MKKFIQLFLFSILILISIYFYRNYLKPIPQSEEIVQIEENDSLTESESNLIKNLKYNVKFDDNSQYSITSEISELTYENGIEIVKMKKTTAIFVHMCCVFNYILLCHLKIKKHMKAWLRLCLSFPPSDVDERDPK